jgi:hypothetical protein
MSTYELPKTYDFKETEQRIYEIWEKGGYFQPHNDPNKPDFDPSRSSRLSSPSRRPMSPANCTPAMPCSSALKI